MDAEAKTECLLIGDRKERRSLSSSHPGLPRSPSTHRHSDSGVFSSQQHIGFCIYYVGLSKAGREEAREIQVFKKGEVDLL